MRNSKQKVKKESVSEENVSKNQSKEDKTEKEIKQELETFEKQWRIVLERTLKDQLKTFEAQLRGKNIAYKVDTAKPYKIQFILLSERMTDQPVVHTWMEVDGNVNEFEFAESWRQGTIEAMSSRKYSDWQQKLYNKLKRLNVKPIEMFQQIESRYWSFDKAEKRQLRDRLRKGYDRKRITKKADKKAKKSTS